MWEPLHQSQFSIFQNLPRCKQLLCAAYFKYNFLVLHAKTLLTRPQSRIEVTLGDHGSQSHQLCARNDKRKVLQRSTPCRSRPSYASSWLRRSKRVGKIERVKGVVVVAHGGEDVQNIGWMRIWEICMKRWWSGYDSILELILGSLWTQRIHANIEFCIHETW